MHVTLLKVISIVLIFLKIQQLLLYFNLYEIIIINCENEHHHLPTINLPYYDCGYYVY